MCFFKEKLTIALVVCVLSCTTSAFGAADSPADLQKVESAASRLPAPTLTTTPGNTPAKTSATPANSPANTPANTDSGASGDTKDDSDLKSNPPPELPPQKPKFQWKPAVVQSMFLAGISNGWRFWHESGTRDALHGPFLKDWLDSISETRGWDDSDGWHASYVSHPFEGGIFGFIEQQNDPLYRNLEWGDGRIYWAGKVRALAFSAIMSTQWTLGPVSEASLGNVQLHASPGFIDLVNTPLLGISEMMGEDLLDRYVIMALENHTANPYLILAARAVANPSRTFANVMALKQPWHRETRPGIFGKNHEDRKVWVQEYKDGETGAPFAVHTDAERKEMNAAAFNPDKPLPKAAPIELYPYAVYESFLGGGSCVGGGGAGAARVSSNWQIEAEVNGCLITNLPKDNGGDSETFYVGPRWTPRATHKISPFAEVLVGARRITHDITDVAKKKELTKEWEDGLLKHDFDRSDYQVEYQSMGVALKIGGGFDKVFARSFAWRVLDVGYTRTWLGSNPSVNAQQAVTVASGLVLRLGTW
jgi:hypothetical protein